MALPQENRNAEGAVCLENFPVGDGAEKLAQMKQVVVFARSRELELVAVICKRIIGVKLHDEAICLDVFFEEALRSARLLIPLFSERSFAFTHIYFLDFNSRYPFKG